MTGPDQAEADHTAAVRLPSMPRQYTAWSPLGLMVAATADPSVPMPMRKGPYHFVPSKNASVRAPSGLCQYT